MITPSNITIQEYNDALALERFTHARVTFVLENIVFEDIEFDYNGGITVSSYMNPDTNLVFGTASCREVVIHFIRSEKTDDLNWTNEFKLEFGVDVGDDIEWITVGYFTGVRPTWDGENVIEFLAYDRMTRFDRPADDFLQRITYPCTIQDIYDDLCSFVVTQNETGDEIASVMEYELTEAPEYKSGLTCRELLSEIAVANCCYAVVTNEGKVKFRWFSDHIDDYALDWNNCFDIKISNLKIKNKTQWKILEPLQWKYVENVQYKYYDNDMDTKILVKSVSMSWGQGEEKIVITQPADGTYSSWNIVKEDTWAGIKQTTWGALRNDSDISGNEYVLVDNPFIYHGTEADIRLHLQAILNRLYAYDMTYIAIASAIGNWLIEDGDIIHFEVDRNKPMQKYPVFNHVLNWNGSCRCNYETTGTIQKEIIYIG